jgi:transcriptional regulator with XRE-family HTH domain
LGTICPFYKHGTISRDTLIIGVIDMFRDKLKALRQDNDLTQSVLANKLNITRTALSKYENTYREPSYDLLVKIALYFNVSTDYLLDMTDISIPYPPAKHK